MCKKKCCILLLTCIYSLGKLHGSISGLFRRESVGFSLDTVVFLARHDLFYSPEFIIGKLMLGRLIKAPDQ